jgi:calcineurin-like phosphoesterase family protein
MAVFFTADTHFGHANICIYCDRPYRKLDGQPDVMAMNRDLVKQWNESVTPQDVVYHLGDFGFGPPAKLLEARKQLNGKIILIKGNHDKKVDKWLLHGDEYHQSLMVGSVFLTHAPPVENPFDVYRHVHINDVPDEARVILCGHVHDRWADSIYVKNGAARTIYNVGVDIYKYRPMPLEAFAGLTDFWKEDK